MSLPFELAKALKNAGWPQPDFDKMPIALCDERVSYPDTGDESDVCCYSPPLEELIDACPKTHTYGDGDAENWFGVTYEDNGKWRAGYLHYEIMEPYSEGESPAEAVARLWLALREK